MYTQFTPEIQLKNFSRSHSRRRPDEREGLGSQCQSRVSMKRRMMMRDEKQRERNRI